MQNNYRILGRSLIFARNEHIYSISQYILVTSDELSIYKKSLIRMARERNFPVLKALIGRKPKYPKCSPKCGSYKENILDEIGVVGVLSDQKAGFNDL